jgi:hypothetical protein
MQPCDVSPDVLTLPSRDEPASTVQGGLAYVADIAGRQAPHVARSEPGSGQWPRCAACSVRSSGRPAGSWPNAVGTPPQTASRTCGAGPTGKPMRSAMRCDTILCSTWGAWMRDWSSTRLGFPSRAATRLASLANTAGRWARLTIGRHSRGPALCRHLVWHMVRAENRWVNRTLRGTTEVWIAG